MVFYILVLGIMNFVVRLNAIKSQKLNYLHFKVYDTKSYEVPERVIIFGRHFDNQFQLPMLFLITCLVAQTTPLYGGGSLLPLAWSFVASRAVHSYIHLGSNNVRFRALSYFAGWIIIITMWLVVAMNAHV